MRYHCCVCDKQFASKEAIDGFDQGYRSGFLCPHCGANLDGHFDFRAWLRGEGQPLSAIVLGCLLAMMASFQLRLAIPLRGFSFPLWLSFAAVALGTGLVLAIRQPQALFDPLMHTRRVSESQLR